MGRTVRNAKLKETISKVNLEGKYFCTEIYLFSFWGVHQSFEVITGLNFRFIGNMHMHMFSTLKRKSWLLRMTLLRAVQVQAGVVKKFERIFRSYTFLFLGILFIQPTPNSNFQPNFLSFTNILLCAGIVRGPKSIVIKVWRTGYASNSCNKILHYLKTSLSE